MPNANTTIPRTCSICAWWQPRDEPTGGCHRHAPVPPPNGQALDRVRWPLVMADDWCGCWQPKPLRQVEVRT